MKTHEKIIIGGLIALLLAVALPVYYDTGDAYNVITKKHGIDAFQRIKAHAPECTDDGVGTNFMPFGTSVSYCGHYWFILFNIFPFQTSGGEIPPAEHHALSDTNTVFLCGRNIRADRVIVNGMNVVEIIARVGGGPDELNLCPNIPYLGEHFFDAELGIAAEEWHWDVQGRALPETPGGTTDVYRIVLYSKHPDYAWVAKDPFNQSVFIYKLDFTTNRIYRQEQYDGSFTEIGFINSATTRPDEAALRANCAREIPLEQVDDSLLDPEAGTVTMWWWDGEAQENVRLTVPYEPEKDFAGCSESVTTFLKQVYERTPPEV